MTTVYEWRGAFTNQEVNALHAEAFNTRVFEERDGTGPSLPTATAWAG